MKKLIGIIICGFLVLNNQAHSKDLKILDKCQFHSFQYNQSEENDSASTNKRKDLGINYKIAIPVSILVGGLTGRIIGYAAEEDGEPGETYILELIGFFAGFTASMVIFLIISKEKSRTDINRNYKSSFNISLNYDKVNNSKVYFLNYKYYF